MKNLFKSTRFYLILSIFIGACLRLYGLSIQGLWFDEAVSEITASSHTLKIFMQQLSMDCHPPLYPLFLYFWIKIFGNTEIALRLPSAIAGILTLFPMYFLSKKVSEKYTATSATILTAFSAWALAYSQEARCYSFLLLFSALSTLLWLNILKSSKKSEISWKELGMYGLACIAAMYTHYFGILLVLCQFVYLLFFTLKSKSDNSTRKIIILSFILALLYLPWFYLFTYSTRGLPDLSQWLDKPNLASFILLIDFIFNKKLIILLFIPVLLKIKSLKSNILLQSLFYLLVTPVIIVFLLSQWPSINYFFPRYFIIILPAAYLLVSILLSQSLTGIRSNMFVFIVSFISILLFLFVPGNNFLNSKYTYYGPYKQQWREAQKYISENYEPNSLILLDRGPDYFSYYFNRFNKANVKYNIVEYLYPSTLSGDIKDLKIGKKMKRVFIIADFVEIPQETRVEIASQGIKCTTKSYNQVYVHDCRLK